MFKITTVHTRPNIETQFFRRGADVADLATDAKLNGKLLSEESVLSEDKLTVTYVAVWDSFNSFDAFTNEPNVVTFRAAKLAHNVTNNIVQLATKQETI